MKWLFCLLPGSGRARLLEGQAVLVLARIKLFLDLNPWGTRLTVPIFKLTEITPVGVCHRRNELIASDRHPIMSLEVQIHTATKAIDPE